MVPAPKHDDIESPLENACHNLSYAAKLFRGIDSEVASVPCNA